HHIQLNMRDITSDEEPQERAPTQPPATTENGRDPADALLALELALRYATDREVAAVIAASSDSKKFLTWLEGFYGDHVGQCRVTIGKAVERCVKAGIVMSPDYSDTRCRDHRQ